MQRDHEWLNQNAGRDYPLAEGSTHLVLTGPAGGPTTLPQDLLVDLKYMVPVSVPFPQRIGSVSFTGVLLSVLIVDDNGDPLAGSTINIETVEKLADLELATLRDGVTGVVTFGEGVEAFRNGTYPPGKYTFDNSGARLESTVGVPYQTGAVLSVSDAKEERDETAVLVGDVKFIPGNNIRIRRDTTLNALVFELLEVETFTPICERGCVKGNCAAGAITRLAGVAPHPQTGRISIRGENGTSISIEDGKIILSHSLRLADLCNNYDRAPEGRPGAVGPLGLPGRSGVCICGECDLAGTGFTPLPHPPSPPGGSGF